MSRNILKVNWERFREHIHLDKTTISKCLQPYTDQAITNIQLLTDGCANSNYRITLGNDEDVILRIYARDETALKRERHIMQQVQHLLPVPEFLYHDDKCQLLPHAYAIQTFCPGEVMRNVILRGDEQAISECAYTAGQALGLLKQLQYPKAGFFQPDLTIRPFDESEQYLNFLEGLLAKPEVYNALGQASTQSVKQWIHQHLEQLPDEHDANLIHADFDPSNLLVAHKDGRYVLSGIVDWEFSMVCHYAVDMGTFLRFSHKLPNCYQQQFINGIQSHGDTLPDNWLLRARLMDMLNLLNFLYWNPADQRPVMNEDVVQLIRHTVRKI